MQLGISALVAGDAGASALGRNLPDMLRGTNAAEVDSRAPKRPALPDVILKSETPAPVSFRHLPQDIHMRIAVHADKEAFGALRQVLAEENRKDSDFAGVLDLLDGPAGKQHFIDARAGRISHGHERADDPKAIGSILDHRISREHDDTFSKFLSKISDADKKAAVKAMASSIEYDARHGSFDADDADYHNENQFMHLSASSQTLFAEKYMGYIDGSAHGERLSPPIEAFA